ncbi:MAG: GMC family oxidoreductase, partial [Ilumatobacteraceae bacterium]
TLDVSSAGRVWLPDPEGPPHVDLHQFDDPRDLDRLVAAASELLELVGRPAIRAVTGAMYVDEHGTTTDDLGTDPDDVRRWVFESAGGHHHVSASCRIGVVTDRHGWVAGYRGLAIADASSFPTVPRIDPYVAVIGLAERLASNWRDSPPG